MELTLDLQQDTLVRVVCNETFSHTFDLQALALPDETAVRAFLDHPDAYGKKLYAALFPLETLAHRTLANRPARLLLVALQDAIDAVPWEYAYGPYGSTDLTGAF